MNRSSWKIASVILLVYTIVGGFLMDVPRLAIVNETIRALYFHVPMWFTMIPLFLASTYFAILYLRGNRMDHDLISVELAHAGLVFGLLGIFTGMIWANYTWGTPWHGDPKQNGAAITTLIYLAYFVLRSSLSNDEQRARLSAAYNIFAFAAMIPLIFIIPRMTDSMHPGNGGNPAFNMYDLDSSMKKVFYPATIGWIGLGFWIASVRIRLRRAEERIFDLEYEKDK
ncbi:MAG TPA: cytochrome c biogenesis protein CcsA [Cyclobacteriaceae bacterium]|nr:cytochrome c biogenesis protein CcsA [Cyclobacteriaceae bacterium]